MSQDKDEKRKTPGQQDQTILPGDKDQQKEKEKPDQTRR